MPISILDNPTFFKEQVFASALASYDNEPIVAFDPSSSSRWASQSKTDWLQICFRTVLIKLTKYTYSTEGNPSGSMHGSLKSWDLNASIDGSTWDIVDNITN